MVLKWKVLLEREDIKSFQKLNEFLNQKNGFAPKSETIIINLRKFFELKGWDFYSWVRKNTKYSRACKNGLNPPYTEREILMWKSILEKSDINSFSAANRYLKKIFQYGPGDSLIIKKITNLFKKKGWNLKLWINQNNLHYYYNDEDILEWRSLIEREDINSIPEACEYLRNKFGFGPTYVTMKKKLAELFRKLNLDFDIWLRENNLRVFYSEQEVESYWIPKFEDLGNFTRVGECFRVDPGTVQARIKGYFGKNFLKWYKQHSKKDLYQTIGLYAHILLELLFMEFMREKCVYSCYEVKPSSYDNDYVCDNLVLLNSENQYSEILHSKIKKNILMISIDYTLSSERITFTIKSQKGYHGGQKYLVIVSLLTEKIDITIPNNAIHKKNLLILNSIEFAEFIGYNEEYLIEYKRIIELIKNAILYKDYQQLEMEAERAQQSLEDEYGTLLEQQNNLEEYLLYENEENLSYLLKEVNPKDIFDFL